MLTGQEVSLSVEELSDLRDFIYNKLRYEFGKQVSLDWTHNFTKELHGEIKRLHGTTKSDYFESRNKRLVEMTERNNKLPKE